MIPKSFFTAFGYVLWFGAGLSFAKDGPLTPEESVTQFQLDEGLRIEIVAAEPQVIDPVAIAFDEHGRMLVAENRGYPLDEKPARGVVALLEDRNEDGRYEHRTDFATGLTFPNGLLPWKGGVIVTCAPDILYLKDTTGDGVADEKRVLLTGFSVASTTQLRVSHPVLGLDGWIYLTAGLQGGEVYAPSKPERGKVKFSKNDSRFHPETLEFQVVSGRSQYGQTMDDFGNRFTCANRNPIWHHVFHPWHLKRNPDFPFTEATQIVGDAQGDAKVFPLSQDTTTAGYHARLMGTPHAGSFTSACATYLFRGYGLGTHFDEDVFICEPAQNLVQRQKLFRNGASFDSKRVSEKRDFLATDDSWSRMVYATQGPEGGLYLVDFYRKTLDHPQYLPEEMRAGSDFQSGRDCGRIYRIVQGEYFSDSGVRMATPPKMTRAFLKENPFSMGGVFGWLRDTEFRLQMEALDSLMREDVMGALTNRYGLGHRNPIPARRNVERCAIRALWLLHAADKLEPGDFDKVRLFSPEAKEQVARIIEQRIADEPGLIRYLARLNKESSVPERFSGALALGATKLPERLPILAELAMAGDNDKWTDAAIMLAVQSDAAGFAELILTRPELQYTERGRFLGWLGNVVGKSFSDENLMARIVNDLSKLEMGPPENRAAFLAGVLEGLERSRRPMRQLASKHGNEGAALLELMDDELKKAGKLVADRSKSEELRIQALGLFEKLADTKQTGVMVAMLNEKEPLALRLAVIDALVATGSKELVAPLVGQLWRGFSADVARRVVDRMLARGSTTPVLLESIRDGVVQHWMVDANRRGRLMTSRDKKINKLAREVFGALESGDRMAAYEKAKVVLKKHKGDAAKGREVFRRACMSCHKYGEEGVLVGPDLTGVRNQPADALLLHIVVPDYEVYPGYASYEVETNDDRVLSGLLTAETDSSIRLKMAQGIEETISRNDILSIRSTSLSLMPQGLEQTMSEEELAGLIAFLKGQ